MTQLCVLLAYYDPKPPSGTQVGRKTVLLRPTCILCFMRWNHSCIFCRTFLWCDNAPSNHDIPHNNHTMSTTTDPAPTTTTTTALSATLATATATTPCLPKPDGTYLAAPHCAARPDDPVLGYLEPLPRCFWHISRIPDLSISSSYTSPPPHGPLHHSKL